MNKKYIIIIALLLLGEILLRISNIEFQQRELWVSILRIVSSSVLALWYYQYQKPLYSTVDKLFTITLLLPVLTSLSNFLIPDYFNIVNIFVHICILFIWAYMFILMGAKIEFRDKEHKFLRLFPLYYLLPILFYVFSIHPSVSSKYVILLLPYTLIYSCTGTLATFLPMKEEHRVWISWSIALMIFTNLIYGYDTFMERIPGSNMITRALVVISRCMIVVGMIKYFKERKFNHSISEI